jgi:hypothetical protein
MTDRRVLSPGAAADGPMCEKDGTNVDYSEWSEDRLQRRLVDAIESSKVPHTIRDSERSTPNIAQLVFELQFGNGQAKA